MFTFKLYTLNFLSWFFFFPNGKSVSTFVLEISNDSNRGKSSTTAIKLLVLNSVLLTSSEQRFFNFDNETATQNLKSLKKYKINNKL